MQLEMQILHSAFFTKVFWDNLNNHEICQMFVCTDVDKSVMIFAEWITEPL